jgi:hypothetical protein
MHALNAQVHWDAGGQVGVMQRIATGAGPGGASPEPGPVAELHAHLAILPMLRVGPYLSHDIAPLAGGRPSRQVTEAGLRAKLSPPILSAPWQTWGFLGVGYARAYEPSHTFAFPEPAELAVPGGGVVPGQGGGLLEARVGLGLGYRLGRDWEPFLELGGRVGLLFAGSLYERGACGCGEPYAGKDSFALSLSLGLSLNQ